MAKKISRHTTPVPRTKNAFTREDATDRGQSVLPEIHKWAGTWINPINSSSGSIGCGTIKCRVEVVRVKKLVRGLQKNGQQARNSKNRHLLVSSYWSSSWKGRPSTSDLSAKQPTAKIRPTLFRGTEDTAHQEHPPSHSKGE